MKVASVVERHPNIQMIHRLAVVDQFKGNHDAVGKDPARAIRAMELSGKRTASAKDVFVNCRVLEKSRDDTKWSVMEQRGDIALKDKGKYGMDTRTVWFVCETQAEFEQMNAQYPGKILLCDRTFVLDTHNGQSIPQTSDLHEVRSMAKEMPVEMPRVWPMQVSYLPCNCEFCVVDGEYYPENTQCKMRMWRKLTIHNVKIGGVSHEEARTFVGCMVSREKDGAMEEGEVVHYVQPTKPDEKQLWCIRFSNHPVEWLKFVDFCKARSLFMSIQQQNV
jgi:hypothetical protein